MARKAARAGNWTSVKTCADEILKQDKQHPEGWFLSGLLQSAAGKNGEAVASLSKSIRLDPKRFDAAIELASQCLVFLRNREAVALVQRYLPSIANNAYYLDMAAGIYTRLGLHDRAWPLYLKANELQPAIDHFQENLAACATELGKVEQASALYHELLTRHPGHPEGHHRLACLETARDQSHIDRMKEMLDSSRLPAEENVYLYSAIAKELEDLEQWRESFLYYQLAGDAAAGAARASSHVARDDIEIIDSIIGVCSSDWLEDGPIKASSSYRSRSPIYIVGFPGAPTALAEQIVARHSKVENAGETRFMPIVIQRAGGAGSKGKMTPSAIAKASKKDIGSISQGYLNAVDYRLRGHPMFIDSLPENFLNLGFIAKAFPDAQIIHMRQSPMDACVAMYRQSFLKSPCTLLELGEYYVAHCRLRSHWREILSNRVIEVEYESLLADREAWTRILLDSLGLGLEPACLDFHLEDVVPASHWKNWETELKELKELLEDAGISTG